MIPPYECIRAPRDIVDNSHTNSLIHRTLLKTKNPLSDELQDEYDKKSYVQVDFRSSLDLISRGPSEYWDLFLFWNGGLRETGYTASGCSLRHWKYELRCSQRLRKSDCCSRF